MSKIQVKNLKKEFIIKKAGNKFFKKREKVIIKAVNKISFDLDQGDILGYIGMNGAGKTTTMKLLSGILKPTSGEVRVLNKNPFKRDNNLLKKITFISGNKSQLWWDLPAYDTFLLNKKIYQISDKDFNQRLENLTNILNTKQLMYKPVRKLSLGEKMKMELTASLLHNPEILFLDEPTIGIDILSKREIHKFLRQYIDQNKATMILTSHDIDDIENLCNKLIILDKGEIKYYGTPKEMDENYKDEKMIKIKFDNLDENFIKQIEKYYKIVKSNYNEIQLITKIDNINEVKLLAAQNKDIIDIEVHSVPLENIILRIYDEKVF